MTYAGGGDLFSRLMPTTIPGEGLATEERLLTLADAEAQLYSAQIVLALEHLHAKHIMHRNIKLENLLCMPQHNRNDPLTVKLTDFGFACYLKMGEELKLPLGSPLYMAPEIIERKNYDHRVDTWAIGVMTYICLSGTPPFYDEKPDKLKDRICNDDLQFGKQFDKISSHAKDFM